VSESAGPLSPERLKGSKQLPSPTSQKQRQERADLLRDRSSEEKRHKARVISHRVRVLSEKNTLRLAKAEARLEDKL
jgi:hypothetical protein